MANVITFPIVERPRESDQLTQTYVHNEIILSPHQILAAAQEARDRMVEAIERLERVKRLLGEY